MEKTADLTSGIIGKHAVYFAFLSEQEGAVAEFDSFTFLQETNMTGTEEK